MWYIGIICVVLALYFSPLDNMTLKTRITNAYRSLMGEAVYGRHEQYATYGDVDYTVPSERKQRQDYRGIFYRCVRMRAESVGDALIRAWVERESNQNEFKPVENTHPWYVLLRNPSKLWSARDVWEWASLSVDLSGKADFIVDRDARGMPIQLLPVFPEFGRMEVVPSAQGGVKSWVFYRDDGKILPIPREDVVRIDNKSPQSPFETHSLIEAARFELDTTDSMKRYRAGSVENGGFTSPILLTEQALSPSQSAQLRKDWKEFVGVRGLKNGTVAVLGSGTKPYSPLTAKDLEFIQGEAQTDKSIMIICGVPPGLFESTTTRATAEGAQVVFAQLTVSKLVSKYCEQLSHQFEIVFNADPGILYVRPPDVVPLDKEYMLKERKLFLETGQRTINDYLSEDGFNPDPNGNRRYMLQGLVEILPEVEEGVADVQQTALNGAQITALQQIVQAVADGMLPAQTAIELILVGFPAIDRPTANAIIGPAMSFTPQADETEPQRTARHGKLNQSVLRVIEGRSDPREIQWRAIDKKKRRQADLTKPVINAWFADMERKILNQLDEKYGRKFTVTFDPLKEEYDFLQLMSPEVVRALTAGWVNGMALAKVTGLEFPLYAPTTINTITTILSKNATVPATLYEAVTLTIQKGIEANLSRAGMGEVIRKFFDGYVPGKVENIANGLTTSAWESGQSVAYAQAGVTAKEWLSSRDDKVRETHQMADAQRVDISESFKVGDSLLSYPGDPNGPPEEVIGCRCITLPVL